MDSVSLNSDASGRILNLLTNDSSRVERAFYFYHYLVVGPLQAVAIMILLFELVDFSILSGVLLILVLIPLQSIFGKLSNYFRCVKKKSHTISNWNIYKLNSRVASKQFKNYQYLDI